MSFSTRSSDLVNALTEVLGDYRGAFSQDRVFDRACSLAVGAVFSFARKTMTQLLTSLGQTDEDWTAAYRLLSQGRFDPEKVAAVTFRQTLPSVPKDHPYTTVVDVTHVRRTSLKMPGTAWMRAPGTAPWARGFSRGQRFENLCWLTPIQDGYCRAVPLQWLHAPTSKSVPTHQDPCLEWEAGLKGLRWVRAQLDEAGRNDQTLLVLGDGAYDVGGMWTGLPHHTVMLVRCAKNRRLFALPGPTPPHQRGARRKYGPRLPSPAQMRQEKTHWTKLEIPIRGRTIQIKCRVVGPLVVEKAPERPLFVILVKGYHRHGTRSAPKRKGRREPCQYLVNAVLGDGQWQLPIPLRDLVIGTWHRWEVEVCHREIKTSFGLGQMQCWSEQGSIACVQFMAWVFAVLLLAGYKACHGIIGRLSPPKRWWAGAKRWSFSSLLSGLRQQLWSLGQFQPVSLRTPSKPPDIAHSLRGLNNAALGTIRG